MVGFLPVGKTTSISGDIEMNSRARVRRDSVLVFLVPSLLGLVLGGCGRNAAERNEQSAEPIRILNVSYDPTREFYAEYNQAFAKHWEAETGQRVSVEPSHGGSGKQARSVIDGMAADVVTLALAYDIDAICNQSGLIPKDWQSRLPNNSAPYTSTIVFLVRKGNPKGIKDWNDLVKEGVEVVTPDPKTSGGARWNYLAAWGYVLKQELGDLAKLHDPKQAEAVAQAQAKAKKFVKELYAHVKVLDSGARGATLTFVNNGRGDVLLAWENEAFYSINKMAKGGQCEIVVPPVSILAEPSVALVDKVADEHGTRKAAEAYLKYLYSPEGQAIAAKHFYRPRYTESVPKRYVEQFPKIELFTIDDVFGGWQKTQKEHFDDGGAYDEMQNP
jgi:sulfate transport system substrate-binding protein